ncbi:ParA family protein [Leeia oryzae]|uniref:ParA family protein n=1 Tax=Leeia oryzae TaxID=356662 RepID=UPI0003806367|nr:ParA family protein [Leeia oryzae]
MRRVIFNQKGGVGKSTITCNLAAVSAARGLRTLVVDLDPQGNASHYLLGAAATDATNHLADLFEQVLNVSMFAKPANAFVHASPFENLSVLPSSPRLADLEDKLEARYKIYKLKSTLEELESEFDRIYIDTPPALNFYTRSALIAADRCLIPFDCDAFSHQALYNLLANVKELQEDHNADLQVEGIIVNQFQPRATLPRQLVETLAQDGLPVLPAYLGSSVIVRESHQLAKPLIQLDPKHKLTQAYVALYECLEQNG